MILGKTMFQYWLRIIALHAGTPPVVSQTIMSVMFVSLGVFLMGIGFGYLTKTRENLLQHRWVLSAAVALSLGAIFFAMLPSLIRYYGDTDVEFYSALSGTTLLHAIVGAPAIIIATYYVFGILPKKNLKKWMRWTAVLWIASIVLGIVLFLQMFNLLPSMPGM
ncbi:MAG: hypothetical protein ACXV2C_02870 [Candidatus Bathyarchaeia archaeon]